VQFQVNVPFVNPTTGAAGTYTLQPITIPKAESQWLRAPTQIGDYGMTVPADVPLGGISGLGSGVPTVGVDSGNLGTLVFVPVAATSFAEVPLTNAAWVNGPAGAILSDTAQTAFVAVTEGQVTLSIGRGSGAAATVVLTAENLIVKLKGLTWSFDQTGFVDSNGIVEETHVHGGVESGAAETGPPEEG
jgi:phage baseplate assembly protein gpV